MSPKTGQLDANAAPTFEDFKAVSTIAFQGAQQTVGQDKEVSPAILSAKVKNGKVESLAIIDVRHIAAKRRKAILALQQELCERRVADIAAFVSETWVAIAQPVTAILDSCDQPSTCGDENAWS